MPTFTALTTLPGKAQAEALGEALERLTPEPTGVGVFELEDGSGLWEVGGYFEEAPDAAGLALLASMHGAKDFTVSELPETDWVAKVKRELTPVVAGRFFVYGSHDADKVPEDALPLLIEASMAFGTGHHGTTLGCLKALDRLNADAGPQDSVLDLGCGTAVLAMAAARVWPEATILASDIDAVAVEVAEVNVAANDLVGRVSCLEAEGLDHPGIAGAAPFDLVFANILKAPLIALAPGITAALKPGGRVILSGILNEQADEVAAVYTEAGNSVVSRDQIGEWTTIMTRKSV
ncbi:50S ribosomal protein L11 methyltransferase [Roseovarius atlanticus]|uniref:50S ribosomal protein L11 methyltransferase n=1 Tax=Roseovarius atlanticus TaxID=1641875 RepID=UPI001C957027|nr:50S ribosomal protein L11 methyltransferase [Roseovarius atlanticus]MBY5987567.1 50S ribosomal protein L11 methyltransferase [Roseovarius atlanticus]MBY6122958.1 50S ribosomal protein L11 methyltransferase [Roseovarius atlanticus]MBY6147454.1 50S ribosomal protein L11 methyltransferase [Roseovarius atlanticus]